MTPSQKWLKLWTVDFTKRDGASGTWTFASRKTIPDVASVIEKSEKPIRPDAIIIVALVDDKNEEKIVITEEFRVPLGGTEWGFPAGLLEQNESIEDAARRELKEETGLDLIEVVSVSPPLYSSAGMTDESCAYVFVMANGTISKQFLEEGENISAHLFSAQEAYDLLKQEGKYGGAKMSSKMYPVLAGWVCQHG